MNRLVEHILLVAKEDVRLYFAPFKGAIDAIRKELQRPRSSQRVRLDKRDN